MNIYFVTVFYPADDKCINKFAGYFTDLYDATEAVVNNEMDIFESTYDYAVIEEYPEGFYQRPVNQWFYKFDADIRQYKGIEEPLFYRLKL